MNIYLVIILFAIIGNYLLNVIVETLNLKHLKSELPGEYLEYFDEENYKTSQNYLRENTRFGRLTDTIVMPILVVFILAGGFNLVDQFARSFPHGFSGNLDPLLGIQNFCHRGKIRIQSDNGANVCSGYHQKLDANGDYRGNNLCYCSVAF